MPELTVGVDLGGTNIKVGLVTDRGEIVHRHRVTTESQRGPEAVAERICGACRDLLAAAGSAADSVRGVGVGSPGTIDIANGVVLFSPNLVGWHDIPLRGLIEDGLGMRCVIDNDANVAALAEQWVGVGQGAGSLVLLTLGTGIGGGIVLDGRIFGGRHGWSGEIGHMALGTAGAFDEGGTLESYAGQDALHEAAGLPRTGSAADIVAAARAGEPRVLAALERAGAALGVALANVVHVVDVDRVVLGGIYADLAPYLRDAVLAQLERRVITAPWAAVEVDVARAGRYPAMTGAALEVLQAVVEEPAAWVPA